MPTKFEGRPGDLTWGKYDYPVTISQKKTLDGLWWLFSGKPSYVDGSLPHGMFYSQTPKNGDVVIGINHRSVTVDRYGQVRGNTDRPYRNYPGPRASNRLALESAGIDPDERSRTLGGSNA